MSVFILVIVLFTKGEPMALSAVYHDRFTCETKWAAVATTAQNDPAVVDWVVLGEPCQAVHEAVKT